MIISVNIIHIPDGFNVRMVKTGAGFHLLFET